MKGPLKLIPLLLFILCSCDDWEERREAFTSDATIRLEENGNVRFAYSPLTCQLSFNRERCSFAAHTDNMSDFYSVQLSAIPSRTRQEVTATISWTTPKNIVTRKNVTLNTLKIEDDIIWLWSSSGKTGLIFKILE